MANKGIKKEYNTVRASISFSQDIYNSLEEISLDKKASIAWVVVQAVYFYLLKTRKDDKESSGNV
jgi:hypothetical protein